MPRAAVVWLVLVALLAALSAAAGHHVGPRVAVTLAMMVALVVAVGARTSFVLAGLRTQRIAIDDDAGATVPAAVVGITVAVVVGGLGYGVAVSVPWPMAPWAVMVGSGAVAVLGATLWPLPTAFRPVDRAVWPWLLSGALLAALMAATVGAVVAVGRFGGAEQVPPGALCRTLAGTFLCDGLIGIGGFARAATSIRRGLVRVPVSSSLPSLPGPIIVALALAAIILVVGPSVVPTVTASTAIVIKVIAGALVGGSMHLSGGVRGVTAALSSAAPGAPRAAG